MSSVIQFRRWRAAAVAVALSGATGIAACSDFLVADNPAAIPAERLADSSLIELMANSSVGSFQDVYPWLSYYSAIFVDELRNHHVFFEEGLFDQRRVTPDNGTYSTFHYAPLQRARWLADSLAGRIKAIEGDSASRDLRVARTYAFAGYGLIMLAEYLCEAPISSAGERYTKPFSSEEIFKLAEMRFDSALKIAAASRDANAKVTSGPSATIAQRYVLGADSVKNLALVGMARSALGRNDKAKAISFAQQVTAIGTTGDFEYRLYYNNNTALALTNFYQDRLSGGAGVTTGSVSGTPFIGLDDSRVPHPLNATGQPLAEVATGGSFVVPNAGPSFSVFNNTKTGADFTYNTAIRLASLLEARYIIAEAGGASGNNTGGVSNIAFIESRRTGFPSSTAQTPTTAANYMDNLIDQRRRDFFLDGHRMGDLRRWKKFNNIDLWPKGSFFGSATVTYGDQMCWPLNTAEISNNPLVPKPYVLPNGP
jgi:hypothetical protein